MKKIFRRYTGLVWLNIAGLALGLTSVIFIAIWILHELSYDKSYKNAERIFRVESLLNMSGEATVWKITPAPVAKSLRNDFPEVEDAVVLQTGFNRSIKVGDKIFKTPKLYYTDHSFFDIFTPSVISGATSRLLTGPDQLVISRQVAASLFGNSDPVGMQVLFNNKDLLTVTAVIEDSPLNTHLRVDYLVPFSLLRNVEPDLESWGRINFMTYVLLKEHADAAEFNRKLEEYWASKSEATTRKFFINPLTRLYLYRDPGLSDEKYPYSDKGLINRVILFSAIGLMILVIACINFINLSTAFASQRAKEIGIRKVNGAGRTNLLLQLFGESVLQTLLATVVALILVIALLPVFANISNVEFRVRELFSMKNIFLYIALTLLTGFVAGIYPALVLSSFNPVKVIRPMPEDVVHGSGLRKVLVVIQFSLSFIFIFCIMIMNRQLAYMQEFDLGFDKDRVMVIYPHSKPDDVDVIAEQIEKLPGIKQVAIGGNAPVKMGNFSTFSKWDGNTDGKQLIFLMMQVEDGYLDLLDIPVVAGRNFFRGSYAEEVIINETAARKMGFEDPIGKFIWNGEKRFPIVGVVRDFHTHALTEDIQPVMMYKSQSWWTKWIFVKLEPGNHVNATADVLKVVERNEPGYPVNYLFLDEEAGKYYENEKRLNILVNAATILTIVISCIGLFSLTAFTIRRRRKEIGVRKAYGATISTVLFMLQKEFGKLVLISCLVSIPAGYYIINRWLGSYTSHISVSPLYFIASILIILLISALTLFYHSYRAASANPATTLRNE